MKIIICTLQVSTGGSKGHFHPGFEIALELQERGHDVAMLALPNAYSNNEVTQLRQNGISNLSTPPLPATVLHSPQKLAELANNPNTVHRAYHSFLVAPLRHQFESIYQEIQSFDPDIIVYDLLVYAAPIAARLLSIPDIGYCAGLKLTAPLALTKPYQTIFDKLSDSIYQFVNQFPVQVNFHGLELLSSTYQFIFSPPEFIQLLPTINLPNVIYAGALPISKSRETYLDNATIAEIEKPILLSFGSALDPADFLPITESIIELAYNYNTKLMISSRKLKSIEKANLTITPYLPLSNLLKHGRLLIHHGGANTFSEALSSGIPQILIPLTTDQPIQAALLQASGAGISIHPKNLSQQSLAAAFSQLLDFEHPIHQQIKKIKALFAESQGAKLASDYIEAHLS